MINETGLNTGFIQRPEPISHIGYVITDTIKPVGDLFLRLIRMVIVPLVFCSLLVGVASLGDVRKLGRLGGKTIGIYLVTTAIAVSFGLLLANTIKPGEFVSDKDRHALEWEYQSNASTKMGMAAESPSTIDNLLNIVPSNPLEAMAEGNMLQVIFFAVMLGVALTLIEPIRSKEIIRILDTVQQAMIVIINMVLAVAPYGVAALLANVLGASGISVLSALLVYMLVVLLGMFLHVVLVYGGLLRFIAKIKWKEFLTAIKPAQLIAFSSSSSSATLPVSIECAEKNLKISNTVASFVLPLGSTVNMDGTALYQGVAAVFNARRILQAIGTWTAKQFQSTGAHCLSPNAAFYVFPDFTSLDNVLKKRNITTSQEFCDQLFKDTHVAVLPGSYFGQDPSEISVRLAFVDFDGKTALEALPEGPVEESFLRQYCNHTLQGVESFCDWINH